MTRTFGDERLTEEIRKMLKRLANLERKVTAPTPKRDVVVVFHVGPGAVSTDVYGPDWLPGGGTLYGAEVRCGTAGSTSSTIAIKRNGSTVTGGSITLASSATGIQHNLASPAEFKDADEITLDVTAGTNLADLTVQLYFRAPG